MNGRRARVVSVCGLAFAISVASCTGGPSREDTPPKPGGSTLPAGFVEELYIGDLPENPTVMRFAPDGRLFVATQGGDLWIVKDRKLLPETFLTVDADFSPVGERGLVGLEFDPEFEDNGHVYVYYTVNDYPAHNRLSRFTADPDDPDRALKGSEKVLLDLPPLVTAFHNGGGLRFAADGTLYIGTGDNIGAGEPQSLSSPFGKILRLNRDGSPPDDNPFAARDDPIRSAVWSWGLRNAFSIDLDRRTDRLMINDTGESLREEVNEGVAGSNYGWQVCEGPCRPRESRFRDPLFSYGRGIDDEKGCAIDGGAFYRPEVETFPQRYRGKYFFIDFCSAWIRMLDPKTGKVEAFASGLPPSNNASSTLTTLEDGPDGALYFISRFRRSIYRIQYTGRREPHIGEHPADQVVANGARIRLEVRASGAGPLEYRWERDGRPLPGEAASVLAVPPATDDAEHRFTVTVSNRFGSVTSREATVRAPGEAPVATITAPNEIAGFSPGDVVSFSGRGMDREDGTLPKTSLRWKVDLHHDEHTHPIVREDVGRSGSFKIPVRADSAGTIFYRITLTVRDRSGLEASAQKDIKLAMSTVTVRSQPPGSIVILDGLRKQTPFEIASVVGSRRRFEAISPRTVDGKRYAFASWSDGGARSHSVETTNEDVTLVARYRRRE